ncbi:MAG: hypothetical protein FJ290_01515 [Planctomycetes bacterium]|nr:hypothetical protein [Planctomycetota bacterium]
MACTGMALGVLTLACVVSAALGAAPASGPLKVHPRNPRYFADGAGKAILLVGSHTWNNLLDMGATDPPPRFDFEAYLDWMAKLNHNFIRLWAWELVSWDTRGGSAQWSVPKRCFAAPQPWLRTGPGKALDDKPKFDLARFNPEYFERLRSRVEAAGKRGIYVSIMLFEGWCMQFISDAWANHPFNPANNVNGINGDPNGDGKGLEVHELAVKAVTAVQEAYVRKVIDTVNDLDNVLYEISNENHPPSTEWQYHMIRFIKDYEKAKPKQHPVGMTFQYKGGSNKALFDSPADWVSPNPDGGYRDDPPPADGRKVVLNDTDHLWGIGGDAAWVWKSFLRGHNPLFMDPYDGLILGGRLEARFDPVRRNIGYALQLASCLDLAAMTPRSGLASSKYCLASPGNAYLVYLPTAGKVTVDLSAAKGDLTVEWLDPKTGQTRKAGVVRGGPARELSAPFQGDAVLLLEAAGAGESR